MRRVKRVVVDWRCATHRCQQPRRNPPAHAPHRSQGRSSRPSRSQRLVPIRRGLLRGVSGGRTRGLAAGRGAQEPGAHHRSRARPRRDREVRARALRPCARRSSARHARQGRDRRATVEPPRGGRQGAGTGVRGRNTGATDGNGHQQRPAGGRGGRSRKPDDHAIVRLWAPSQGPGRRKRKAGWAAAAARRDAGGQVDVHERRRDVRAVSARHPRGDRRDLRLSRPPQRATHPLFDRRRRACVVPGNRRGHALPAGTSLPPSRSLQRRHGES